VVNFRRDSVRDHRQLSDAQPAEALLADRHRLALIMVASLLDSQSNALTRPEQLMFSQFFGFGSAFFLAPAMLAGIGGVFADPRNLVSFSVLFGMSQNIGGLLGSAILGTFQTWREKFTPASWRTRSPP
jgi:hypothetical protein